jgi:hypothetical protein
VAYLIVFSQRVVHSISQSSVACRQRLHSLEAVLRVDIGPTIEEGCQGPEPWRELPMQRSFSTTPSFSDAEVEAQLRSWRPDSSVWRPSSGPLTS